MSDSDGYGKREDGAYAVDQVILALNRAKQAFLDGLPAAIVSDLILYAKVRIDYWETDYVNQAVQADYWWREVLARYRPSVDE